MGLAGKGADIRLKAAEKAKRKRFPWQTKGLTRIERVIRFIEFLPITKGRLRGEKMRLLEGQRRFIEDLYGREGVQIGIKSEPRGNGKTGLVAGLALCHLLGPESDFRGEVYAAAIDREQAGIMFHEIEAMILAVPEFAARTNIKRFNKIIEVRADREGGGEGVGSKFEALSADARRAHGLAPSFWVYDELAQAKNRVLLDNLMTAMGKRKKQLGIVISTQAADDEHPLSQLLDDSLKRNDPAIVVHLTSAPKDADPFSEETIRSVNPALDIFLDAKTLFAEADRAKRMPSFESAFRNLRLNQRIAADQRDMFITPDIWKQGNEAIDEALFTSGRPVWGGLDLSARVDLTALMLACADDRGIVHLKAVAWTPVATVEERTRRDRVPYDAWVRQGLISTTPGKAIDYEYVAADIAGIVAPMNLQTIAFDDWHMNDLIAAANRIGHVPPLSRFRQGFKTFAPAVGIFEVLAKEGRLRHGGHPVLAWCVSNTMMERDAAGNRKPDKRKPYGRIDLAVAAIMAVSAMREPVPEMAALIA